MKMCTSWVWFYVLYGGFQCRTWAENATGLFVPLPQHCQRVPQLPGDNMVTEPQYKSSMVILTGLCNQLTLLCKQSNYYSVVASMYFNYPSLPIKLPKSKSGNAAPTELLLATLPWLWSLPNAN